MEDTALKIIEDNYRTFAQKFAIDENFGDLSAEFVMVHLIDEMVLEVAAEYHRAIRTGCGSYFFSEMQQETESSLHNGNNRICDDDNEKKTEDIKCPNCTRAINASRFAPHLEKCMKMGRNSSRIASRRIANNSKENSYGGMVSDDDDDEDWSALSEKIKGAKKIQEPKKKKDKQRKQKSIKNLKEDIIESKEGTSYNKFVDMPVNDRNIFLSTFCCVPIGSSGRLCSRSLRCNHHTDEERSGIRKLFSEPRNQESFVDVEEIESKTEAEYPISSADSSTTSCSTKKKEKAKPKNVKSKYLLDSYLPE